MKLTWKFKSLRLSLASLIILTLLGSLWTYGASSSTRRNADPILSKLTQCYWTNNGWITITDDPGPIPFRFVDCDGQIISGTINVNPHQFYAKNNPNVSIYQASQDELCVRLCIMGQTPHATIAEWEVIPEPCCNDDNPICGCILQIIAPEGSVPGAQGVPLIVKFQQDCCGSILDLKKMDGSLKAFNSGTGQAFINPNAANGTYSIFEYQYAYPQGTSQCDPPDNQRRWCISLKLKADGVTIEQWEMHPLKDPCCP